MTINDIHTHSNNLSHHAIVSLSLAQFDREAPRLCSIGIHPWDSNRVTDHDLQLLQQLSQHRHVLAIGECGIDCLRGADIEQQTTLFEYHIGLSEMLKKPLIIHSVKSAHIIISLCKKHKPAQKWIVHGFRGNASTAQQFINHGIELSFGEKFNAKAVAITPIEMLWVESDESRLCINAIYDLVAHAANIEPHELQKSVEMRAEKTFLAYE